MIATRIGPVFAMAALVACGKKTPPAPEIVATTTAPPPPQVTSWSTSYRSFDVLSNEHDGHDVLVHGIDFTSEDECPI